MRFRWNTLWIFQISTFILLIYTSTKSTGYLSSFPFLLPFLFIFLLLKYKELKEEKAYYLFFLYVLSMIPFIHFVLFNKVGIFSIYPLHLIVTQLKNIGKGFGTNRELGFILFMFLSYYLVGIYSDFLVRGKNKIQLFTWIFIFAIWAEYRGRGDAWMFAALPVSFIITIMGENAMSVENGWSKLKLTKDESLSKKWRRYLLPYILITSLIVLAIALIPLHFDQNFTGIYHILSPQHYESNNADVNNNNEKKIMNSKRPGKRVEFIKKYENVKSPAWLKWIASWKVPVIPVVSILLIEFAILLILVMYRILSEKKKWYLLLLFVFIATTCGISIIGFLGYKIIALMSGAKLPPTAAGRLNSWMKGLNFTPPASAIMTKLTIKGSESILFLTALKNLLSFIMVLIGIFVMAVLILEGIKNIKMKGKIETRKKVSHGEEKEEVMLDEVLFRKLLSEDPGLAIKFLYSYGRSHFFTPFLHLTPYEFLEKINDKPGLIPRIWNKITNIFIKVRYSRRDVDEDDAWKTWEVYKNIDKHI